MRPVRFGDYVVPTAKRPTVSSITGEKEPPVYIGRIIQVIPTRLEAYDLLVVEWEHSRVTAEFRPYVEFLLPASPGDL